MTRLVENNNLLVRGVISSCSSRNPVDMRDPFQLQKELKEIVQHLELPKGISLLPEIRTPDKLCY